MKKILIIIMLIPLSVGCKKSVKLQTHDDNFNSGTKNIITNETFDKQYLHSFEELNIIFCKPFIKNEDAPWKEKYLEDITPSSFSGFRLSDVYESVGSVDLFFGSNHGYSISIRLLIDNNLIKAIGNYYVDHDNGESFYLRNYSYYQQIYNGFYYQKNYDKREDYMRERSLTIWDTGQSFIMMGTYNKYIYYVALVDKSIVRIPENKK